MMAYRSPIASSGALTRARTPLWLCLSIVGLAAWIYLGQTDRVSAANAELQQQQQMTAGLLARRQEALAALGRVSAPSFILTQAQSLGMTPGNWGDQP
jgi:hypothetical protein